MFIDLPQYQFIFYIDSLIILSYHLKMTSFMNIEWDLYAICVAIVVGYLLSGWLVTLGIKINYGRLKNSISHL